MTTCPFHNAARFIKGGNHGLVRSFLQSGGSPNACDGDNYSLLHLAAQEGKLLIATLLLDAGAQVDLEDVRGFTPLHQAVGENHPKVVALLLAHGANPNHKCHGNESATPLHTAAVWGRVDIAMILLKAGALPDELDGNGKTPLMYAKKLRQRAVFKLLQNCQISVKS